MTNPSDLVDSIAAALRAIPDVMALLDGDTGNVQPFKRHHPLRVNSEQWISEQKHPSVLVLHTRTWFDSQINHGYSLVLKPRGSPDALFKAIRDGVPVGPQYRGDKFCRLQIDEAYRLITITDYLPRILSVAPDAYTELNEILITIQERGIDA